MMPQESKIKLYVYDKINEYSQDLSAKLRPMLQKQNITFISKIPKALDVQQKDDRFPGMLIEITPKLALFVFSPQNSELIEEKLRYAQEFIDFWMFHYEKVIFILHKFQNTYVNISSPSKLKLHGLLLKYFIQRHLTFLPCESDDDLCAIITSLSTRVYIKDKPPNIGREKPKRKTTKAAQLYFIEGLHATGKKKAQALLSAFGTPKTIIQLLQSDSSTLSGKKSPKQLHPILDMPGFGIKYLQNNYLLLFTKY